MIFRYFFILISCLIWSYSNLLSQKFGMGLVFDEDEFYKVNEVSRKSNGSKSFLELGFKVDLKPYCPKIRQQGKIGSCVGWSSGYAAMSIEYAIYKGWRNDVDSINRNAFSALFVYNQIKINDCESGALVERALQKMQEKGNICSKDFDIEVDDCMVHPTDDQLLLASKFRLKDYASLFNPNDEYKFKIDRVKATLAQNKPVIISMVVTKSFLEIDSDGMWYPEKGDSTGAGGHALCVVGYDEALEAFELMNSWGSEWGNKGFCWIRYKDFAKYCKYAFLINLGIKEYRETNNHLITLQSELLKPYSARDGVKFSNIPLRLENEEFVSTNLANNNRFQLRLSKIKSGTYLYIINYTADRNASLLFPESYINGQNKLVLESARIIFEDTELSFPNPASAYLIEPNNAEYFLVLLADNPIPDLPKKIRDLENLPKDAFIQGVKIIFDNLSFTSPKIGDSGLVSIETHALANKILALAIKVNMVKL